MPDDQHIQPEVMLALLDNLQERLCARQAEMLAEWNEMFVTLGRAREVARTGDREAVLKLVHQVGGGFERLYELAKPFEGEPTSSTVVALDPGCWTHEVRDAG